MRLLGRLYALLESLDVWLFKALAFMVVICLLQWICKC